MTRWIPGAALILVVSLLAPRTAEACVRTVSCSEMTNPPCGVDEVPRLIAWPTTCVGFHVNELGSADIPDFAEVRGAVAQSFATWNEVEGSYLELIDLGNTNVHQAGYDNTRGDAGNVNAVMFVDDRWPNMYPPAALALTRVTYTTEGVIVDADIEVNGRFPFQIFEQELAAGETTSFYDLPSTLVHEVGHLVGLDHTEEDTFNGPIEELDLATMHASSGAGQLHKRSLHPDDIVCLEDAYPPAEQSSAGTCDPVPNSDFWDAVAGGAARGWGEYGAACLDGIDNDSDGLVDCDEPDCAVVIGCTDDRPTTSTTRRRSGCQTAGPDSTPGAGWVLILAGLLFSRRRGA